MQNDLVSVSASEGIAVIAMGRPPVNAMSKEFMSELESALRYCSDSSDVRVVLVTSAVPRVFSAGADIREMSGLDSKGCEDFVRRGQQLFWRIGEVPKPVIAVVSGVCVGGGLELSMSCDLRVAGQSARFGQPEVNLGIVPGWGGTQRLPRLVGSNLGMEMLWLGEQVSADEAARAGLLNRVVPDERLMEEAMSLAQALRAKSPTALAKIKESVQRGLGLPLDAALHEEARCYVDSYVDGEATEGIAAFLEKRPARF